MAKRTIIKIDYEKCNGCGLCIPNCPEGALRIIDGKARFISDLFCDGLGACIGHCPEGAITLEEREAEPYDERRVMENIIRQGKNVIMAHLAHLREHKQNKYLGEAIAVLKEKNIEVPGEKSPEEIPAYAGHAAECPGTKVMDFRKKEGIQKETEKGGYGKEGIAESRQKEGKDG